MLVVHEARMPEQNQGDTASRESHIRRRLRLAEDLAAQMRAAPEQRQPQPQRDDRPLPAATVPRPIETVPRSPPAPDTHTPPPSSPVAPASPLVIEADWPLLREFMNDASQLRQLSVGDLLDGAFRLYRRRFAFLVAIAALLFPDLRRERAPVAGGAVVRPG
jgi:hypothetical protein